MGSGVSPTAMMSYPGNVHVRIRVVEGTPERVWLFHRICTAIDPTWPWQVAGATPTNKTYMNRFVCKVCKGRTYTYPRILAQDIKAAAQQVGIRVKVEYYYDERQCKKDGAISFVNDPLIDNTMPMRVVKPMALLETAKK